MNLRQALLGAAFGIASIGLALPAFAAAPAPAAPPSGPVYPAANPKGHYTPLNALPDWGGVWVLKFNRPAPGAPPREKPDPKGKYLDAYNAAKKAADANNGEMPRQGSYCNAPGVPYIMGVGQYPMEFLFTPGRVTTLHEAWTGQRRIYTDGRPHPPEDELDPSFYGHSTGHWEGDTLVVDTVGLKDTTSIATGIGHSEKMKVTERIHLAKGDPNTMIDEMTITDPEALTKPFHQEYQYTRHRDLELLEFICAENDRNPLNDKGTAGLKP